MLDWVMIFHMLVKSNLHRKSRIAKSAKMSCAVVDRPKTGITGAVMNIA